MNRPYCSIVIPAKGIARELADIMQIISQQNKYQFECNIVVDSKDDLSAFEVLKFRQNDPRFNFILNQEANNPAAAIKTGFRNSKAKYVIVMMGDGSDNPTDIPKILEKLISGYSVVCASRYMAGGKQIGAKRVKSFLSRTAGLTFKIISRLQLSDLTNNFKGYSKDFLDSIEIESTNGFEIGTELTVKAYRKGLIMGEIPTTWKENTTQKSNFKIVKWAPAYLKWYANGILFRIQSLLR